MDDQELARTLTAIFDRLESLADQSEKAAMTISAIRGALVKASPAFKEEYDRLYSSFAALAANRSADAALQEMRQQLSQSSHPTP